MKSIKKLLTTISMSINFFSGPFAPNHENSIHRKEFPKASWLKGQEKEASQKRSIGRTPKRASYPVAAGAGGGGEDGRARAKELINGRSAKRMSSTATTIKTSALHSCARQIGPKKM